MTDAYLTLSQAAPLVGLSATSLRAYAKNGSLKAIKVGPVWMTTEAEARRFATTPRPVGRPRNNPVTESCG